MQNKFSTIIISSYDDIKNPHYGGGGAIAVHEIAKRLSETHSVRVLSWDYCGKKQERIDGVQYERFGFPRLSPKLAMFFYQLSLPFIAHHKKYDLWLESFCPPFTTAFLPLFTKRPVVGVVHMLAAEDMERKYKLPFHLIQNAGLKVYRSVITTSDGLKQKVQSIHPKGTITVISNGIDKVLTPTKRKEKYFLFLGRIEADQKGLDLLLESFVKFQKELRGYKLVIAGSGDALEMEKLKKLIKILSLEDTVILKGKVTGLTKETLLQNATAVVIPSRFETYSLVALEAMAHGAPVLCFAIDGLSWIPKKAALKVQPFSIELLTKALITIVSDANLAESLKKEGSTYAKNFTWDRIADQYKKYIADFV